MDGIRSVATIQRVPDDAVSIFGQDIVPKGHYGTPDERTQDPRNAFVGTMILLPEVRQLWQIFTYPSSVGRTVIAVRDLDSLKIVKTIDLNLELSRSANKEFGGEWAHAVDPGRRIFLMADTKRQIIEIDLKTFAQKRYPFNPQTDAGVLGGLQFGGISYDPFENALWALLGGPSSGTVANVNTVLYRMDLATGQPSPPRSVRSCGGPVPATDEGQTLGSPVLIDETALYVPCHRAGYAVAVVRLDKTTALDAGSVEELAVGPVFMDSVMVDSASQRMYFLTYRGEIWAFDARTMSFIGVIGTSENNTGGVRVGIGIDASSGRLFFQSPHFGFGLAEGRFFPIPQARTLASARSEGQEFILSDHATGRVFVLGGWGLHKANHYTIYQVDPAPAPPPPPDPDLNTTNHAEEDGKTETRFFGSGTGYGARVLLANGLSTTPPAPSVGLLAPTAQIIAKNINSKCGFTDRELVAGRVARAQYDTGSTAAEAIAVGVDERTKVDLTQPSRCDITIRNGGQEYFSGVFATSPQMTQFDKGPGWNRKPAACTSSEGGEPESGDGQDGNDRPLGTSHVECPLPGGKLVAEAESSLVGAVSVGDATTKSSIQRGSGGVVAEVTSTARDIGIAGVIQISEVRSIARSAANGRPQNKEMSTHDITIKGVIIAGQSVCGEECDVNDVLTQLNRAASGRAQFRAATGLDDGLRRGTPKGALTAVQKSAERQASDQALVGDFTTEVPGLEMIVYNDNNEWGRARQLYQFAGVATAATYNIALRPAESAFDDEPSGVVDDLADGLDGGVPDGRDVLEPLTSVREESDGSAGGPIMRALRALAKGIRMFVTDPRKALLLLTGWTLFSLPAVLSRRRRLLAAARSA